MDDRLSEVQLQRIIAEVEQISHRRQQELDRQQVQEILQELNLSPELLDEALIQLKRRDALAMQQRRQRQFILGGALALVVLLGGLTLLFQQHQSAIDQVSAQQNRITLVNDDGGNLATVSRQQKTELFYRVTLKEAPIGKKLSLTCNWIDPNQQIVHQNRYQTKEITTAVWTTYCRYPIGPASVPGQWRVQMLLRDRLISETTFDVKE